MHIMDDNFVNLVESKAGYALKAQMSIICHIHNYTEYN